MDHLLSEVYAQLAVKSSDDLEVLCNNAEAIRAAMATVPGVVDLSVEKQVPIPQLQIQLLRAEAR